jgi:aryl-alcohol dehydrogenase-like predicted oxidoreductase
MYDRESMVLTTADYLDCYSSHRIDGKGNHENPFLTFLQTLFQLKNVLFIGYGLNELEVLEYVVQKGIKIPPNTREEPRHYVLQGFFSHERELARSLESYFRQFGIGLLPFSRDERDWDQLGVVIKYLAREIPLGPPLILPKRLEMEELLS